MPARFDPDLHHRRSIRLKGYDYSQAGAYFVTLVSHQRACLFGEVREGEVVLNEVGRVVDECWTAIPAHFGGVELVTHVVMPNHVHGMLILRDVAGQGGVTNVGARGVEACSLGAIIGSFKSAVTKRVGRELKPAPVWQRNYYEHIIRNEREMEKIWLYVRSNPVTWADDDENPARMGALAA